MKKVLAMLLAATMALTAMAGCGSTETQQTSTEQTTEETTETTEAEQPAEEHGI